jgi:hypothetical protein
LPHIEKIFSARSPALFPRSASLTPAAGRKAAKDTELIGYATDIRYRAERKGGALLIELREKGERHEQGQGVKSRAETLPTLGDLLGVTKTQSSRWQALAKLPEERFEERLQRAKQAAENSTTSAPRHPRVEFAGAGFGGEALIQGADRRRRGGLPKGRSANRGGLGAGRPTPPAPGEPGTPPDRLKGPRGGAEPSSHLPPVSPFG